MLSHNHYELIPRKAARLELLDPILILPTLRLAGIYSLDALLRCPIACDCP